MIEADDLCLHGGLHRPVSNQPRYSLLWRQPEREVFPLALARGMGQVTFSPLAHGVLSGKYKPGEAPPAGTRGADPAQNEIMMSMYFGDERLRRVQRMGGLARELKVSSVQLAIAWVLRNPAVSSVIAGATRVGQLEEILGAPGVSLPAEVVTELDQLFPLPAAYTGP
jgi:aryl-alcohol dehydrogenase-like predicted oxidoreductase